MLYMYMRNYVVRFKKVNVLHEGKSSCVRRIVIEPRLPSRRLHGDADGTVVTMGHGTVDLAVGPQQIRARAASTTLDVRHAVLRWHHLVLNLAFCLCAACTPVFSKQVARACPSRGLYVLALCWDNKLVLRRKVSQPLYQTSSYQTITPSLRTK